MPGGDPKLETLRSVPLFANLGRGALDSVSRVADTVDLPAGKVLMRQGETGRELFVLVSGEAKVEREGRPPVVAGPGAILGEMAVVSEGPRTATVTLTEPSTLIVIGHRDFHTLLDDSPEILRGTFEALAQRIRTLEGDICH